VDSSLKMISMLGVYRHVCSAVLMLCLVTTVQSATLLSDGKSLYAPCVVCHQPNAWGSPDGNIPSLAAQQASYLIKQLAMFKSGTRTGTAMQLVTAHSTFNSEQNIIEIAQYLSSLEPNPQPVKGSGQHCRAGKDIYAHMCGACHGIEGRGEAGREVPGIAGQHYPYLRRQIDQAAPIHRNLVPRSMALALRNMRDTERDAVADFLSRYGECEPVRDSYR